MQSKRLVLMTDCPVAGDGRTHSCRCEGWKSDGEIRGSTGEAVH